MYPGFIAASHAAEAPTDIQRRSAYDAVTNLMLYLGYAPHGAATSATVWMIFKYTYDANGLETLKQTGYGAWDARDTTVTYA